MSCGHDDASRERHDDAGNLTHGGDRRFRRRQRHGLRRADDQKVAAGHALDRAEKILAGELAVHHRQAPETPGFQLLAELKAIAEEAKTTPAFKNKLGPYFSGANAYAELGRERECLKEIDFVISNVVADGRLGAMLEKARLLNLLGQYQASLKLCGELRSEFTTASPLRRIALIEADAHHKLKDSLKAEGLLRDLLADDPDDVLVRNNLGYNLADQNRRLDEAERLIRRAIELDRDERARAGEANLEHAAKLMKLQRVVTSKRFIDRTQIDVPGTEYVFLEDVRAGMGKLELLRRLLAVRYLSGIVKAKQLSGLSTDPDRPAGGPTLTEEEVGFSIEHETKPGAALSDARSPSVQVRELEPREGGNGAE